MTSTLCCLVCNSVNTKSCSNCNQARYCSVDCQKSDRKMHKSVCYPCKVDYVDGKGKGLIATRDIEAGQQVLLDTCILSQDAKTIQDPEEWLNLKSKVGKLSVVEKEKFYGLKPREVFGTENVELAIFLNNGIALAAPEVDSRCGIFPKISFINHSCSPNCQWSPLEKNIMAKEVRALVRVKKGEEITCSYYGDNEQLIFADRDMRVKYLSEWGFKCSCEICSLTGKSLLANEENRARLENVVAKINSEEDSVKKAALSLKKLDMIRDMGREMLTELTNAYQHAYVLCWSSNDDELQFKAELFRLDWKVWINKVPLYSIRLKYYEVIQE